MNFHSFVAKAFKSVPLVISSRTFIVGGAVRDFVMSIVPHDYDFVVVGSTVSEMLGLGFEQTGKDFPVFRHPATLNEFALARSETKVGDGHKGFSVSFSPETTIEQDLERRDLTINAIAVDNCGRIVDPFGGMRDIQNKLLREVSGAFSEDPLRVLRVARFAAQLDGFKITKSLADQMRLCATELKTLSSERVWMETKKALLSQKPSKFFVSLQGVDALGCLFPEVYSLVGAIQEKSHHPEGDAFEHTMMCLDVAAEVCAYECETMRIYKMFAVLCHDLGKGATPPEVLPHHYKHDKNGRPLVKSLSKRLKCPLVVSELAYKACEFHMSAWNFPEMRPGSRLDFLVESRVMKDPVVKEVLFFVCEVDSLGRGTSGKEKASDLEKFGVVKSKIEKASQAMARADFSSVAEAKDKKMAFRQLACDVLSRSK